MASSTGRLHKALGLQKLIGAINRKTSDFRDRLFRRMDRLLGISLPNARRSRLLRTLGIEQLEARMLLSATVDARDGIFTWTDGSGDAQALDVTKGSLELHFTDDANNIGDLTEIRLLVGNVGFDVTTADIDSIDSNGNNIGVLNIGVDVGSELADPGGTIDVFQADNHVHGPVFIDGGIGTLSVLNQLKGTFIVTGDVGSLSISNIKDNAEVIVAGDLDSVVVEIMGNAIIQADHVQGNLDFQIGPGGDEFNLNYTFTDPTQIIYDGTDNSFIPDVITIAPIPPVVFEPVFGGDFLLPIPVTISPDRSSPDYSRPANGSSPGRNIVFPSIPVQSDNRGDRITLPDVSNGSDTQSNDRTNESTTPKAVTPESKSKSRETSTAETDSSPSDGNSPSKSSSETENSVVASDSGNLAQQNSLGISSRSRNNLVDSAFSKGSLLFSRLDNMKSETDRAFRSPEAQAFFVTTVTVLAGYVLYDIRKVSLLSALFSSVPHWKQFDPLTVLQSLSSRRGKEIVNDAKTILGLVNKRSIA